MALIGRADELGGHRRRARGRRPGRGRRRGRHRQDGARPRGGGGDGRPIHEGGAFATLAWMPYLALERALGGPLAGDADWVADAVERRVGPDVLFVDDAQWADARTLAALERLAGRISVVVATRRGDAGTTAVLAALEAAGPVILELAPLDADDAAARGPRRRARADAASAPPRSPRGRAATRFVVEQLAATGRADDGPPARDRGTPRRARPAGSASCWACSPWPAGRSPRGRSTATSALVRQRPRGRHARRRGGRCATRCWRTRSSTASAPTRRRALHARLAAVVDDDGERARHLAAAGEREAAHARRAAGRRGGDVARGTGRPPRRRRGDRGPGRGERAADRGRLGAPRGRGPRAPPRACSTRSRIPTTRRRAMAEATARADRSGRPATRRRCAPRSSAASRSSRARTRPRRRCCARRP